MSSYYEYDREEYPFGICPTCGDALDNGGDCETQCDWDPDVEV